MENFLNIFINSDCENLDNPKEEIFNTSTVNISEYIYRAVPLTLVAFRGGDIVSGLIRTLQNWYVGFDEFSHVGLIITRDICPFIKELEKGRVYVWESTMSNRVLGIGDGVNDIVSKKPFFGVQIRDLEELYPKYTEGGKAKIAICELLSNPWLARPTDSRFSIQKRRAKIIKCMEKVYKKYKRARYELNPIQLGASIFPCMRDMEKGLNMIMVNGVSTFTNGKVITRDDQVFCSEFVAIVYKKLGLIPKTVYTFRVVPSDFFGLDADKHNGIPFKIVNRPIYLRN